MGNWRRTGLDGCNRCSQCGACRREHDRPWLARRDKNRPSRVMDVAAFHADYDKHPGDRVGLFAALATETGRDRRVLYPGSYVDISPSAWYDDVTYCDIDRRTPRFFGETDQVLTLINAKRNAAGLAALTIGPAFHHLDYRTPLPIGDRSFDLLISLYAGFIGEHCARYLRPPGLLFANNSHGDASLASMDPAYRLVGVMVSDQGTYRISTKSLDTYLEPKSGVNPTADELRASGRGVAFTRTAFAYLFEIT